MYCLETLKSMNAAAVKKHFSRHPLKRVLIAEDCRQSPDYSGSETADIERRFKVKFFETFFVDSSGFGSPGEPALTYSCFFAQIARILRQNLSKKFYSCLTGIGQFQVYVSLFYKEI